MPAKTIKDLPSDCFIKIIQNEHTFYLYYCNRDGTPYQFNNKDLGKISFELDPTSVGKNVYSVFSSISQKGFGPLLYDLSMELVNKITNGKGYLKSDPLAVSKDALNVWNYYDKNRSDVQKKQLDSLENELTPTKIDNVDQSFPKKEYKKDWYKSSLSKGFNKKPSLLNSDKIIFVRNESVIKNITIKNMKGKI